LFKLDETDIDEATKLFNLLDFDDDNLVEFPELMLYIFANQDDNLSKEQMLRRSYNFYDNNDSGMISKAEMVEALFKLEKIHPKDMAEDSKGELVIPDDVENLFSLMDFGGEGKITMQEFLKATMHYRRLGMLLTIDLLPKIRKDVLQAMKQTEQKQ
jgi:Ca2+-binding EF-hand superfamily protein